MNIFRWEHKHLAISFFLFFFHWIYFHHKQIFLSFELMMAQKFKWFFIFIQNDRQIQILRVKCEEIRKREIGQILAKSKWNLNQYRVQICDIMWIVKCEEIHTLILNNEIHSAVQLFTIISPYEPEKRHDC